MKIEICVECGKSVKRGSGNFVNRVPVLDTLEEKEIANRPFPKGEWLCSGCDEKIFY